MQGRGAATGQAKILKQVQDDDRIIGLRMMLKGSGQRARYNIPQVYDGNTQVLFEFLAEIYYAIGAIGRFGMFTWIDCVYFYDL